MVTCATAVHGAWCVVRDCGWCRGGGTAPPGLIRDIDREGWLCHVTQWRGQDGRTVWRECHATIEVVVNVTCRYE